MVGKKKAFALIGARGGSKSIPRKNVADLGGFPLIAYSIAAAKLSKFIDRVVVSTDDEEISEIAKKYGAEVPLKRPEELASDTSHDLEFVKHFLHWMSEHENITPDFIVHLRPTTPLRDPNLVDEAIKKITEHSDATSLRSVHELNEPPQKYFKLDNEYLVGYMDEVKDQNVARQSFPKAYYPNGYVDVLKSDFILESGTMHGDKILSFITPNTAEIDGPGDLDLVNFMLKSKEWEVYKYLKEKFGN